MLILLYVLLAHGVQMQDQNMRYGAMFCLSSMECISLESRMLGTLEIGDGSDLIAEVEPDGTISGDPIRALRMLQAILAELAKGQKITLPLDWGMAK